MNVDFSLLSMAFWCVSGVYFDFLVISLYSRVVLLRNIERKWSEVRITQCHASEEVHSVDTRRCALSTGAMHVSFRP